MILIEDEHGVYTAADLGLSDAYLMTLDPLAYEALILERYYIVKAVRETNERTNQPKEQTMYEAIMQNQANHICQEVLEFLSDLLNLEYLQEQGTHVTVSPIPDRLGNDWWQVEVTVGDGYMHTIQRIGCRLVEGSHAEKREIATFVTQTVLAYQMWELG